MNRQDVPERARRVELAEVAVKGANSCRGCLSRSRPRDIIGGCERLAASKNEGATSSA